MLIIPLKNACDIYVCIVYIVCLCKFRARGDFFDSKFTEK